MSDWRLLVTDMMKSCSIATLIRPLSLANLCVYVYAFPLMSYEYRFVCAGPLRSKSALHGGGDTQRVKP